MVGGWCASTQSLKNLDARSATRVKPIVRVECRSRVHPNESMQLRNTHFPTFARIVALALAAGACEHSPTTAPIGGSQSNQTIAPCSVTGTLQLSTSQAARVDCTNGGTSLTLAGNGASYLVVPQFAVSLVTDVPTTFQLVANTAASASVVPKIGVQAALMPVSIVTTGQHTGAAQRALDRALRTRAASLVSAGTWSPPASAAVAPSARATIVASTIPSLGSVRSFRVLSGAITGNSFTTVNARLSFAGSNVLIYLDTLAPAGGFTAAQLQAFGTLFDQTLYPIDTASFGPPSDVDANGHVIMLMTPAVNALTKASDCATNGFVGGFFDEEDLGGSATDPNSNHGEIFYSIVPDPSGTVSCAHSTSDVGSTVPATFLHELQHLISFSQHFVVHNGSPEYGWLDEGLSIVAEELGSLYYEQKCPGTACRSNPAQLFPDSSQGFVQDFLFDSYEYAAGTDTSSVTLHSDSDGGFSWRGGDWLLMRWLGDQMPAGFYRRLDENTATGVANIESVSGQTFPSLFANFGLSLVTDSLPGFPRSTAPAADRFVSRNMRLLWSRLFAADAADFPLPFPIQILPISASSTTASMVPGTNGYFRLDTPAGASTVTIQFTAPGGAALPASLKPQLSVFRLPPGA